MEHSGGALNAMSCPSRGLLGDFLRLLFKTGAVTASGGMTRKKKSFSSAAVAGLAGRRACFQCFHQAAIFNVEEREEMMC